MTRIGNRLLWFILGGVIYAFTIGSVAPVDFAVGAFLAALLHLLLRQFMSQSQIRDESTPYPPAWRRAIWAPLFIVAVARDIVVGTWDVLLYTIGLRSFESAGIVRIPIGDRTTTGVAVSAWAITVAPGSAYVDTDWDAGEMLVHVLEAEEAEKIRRIYGEFYERYQRRVFP